MAVTAGVGRPAADALVTGRATVLDTHTDEPGLDRQPELNSADAAR
jgi:hypothetical protein